MNMKKALFLLMAMFLGANAWSQEAGSTQGDSNWRNRLEIGAGAVKTDLVDVLVKIQANSTLTRGGESGGAYIVLVRFKGEGGINAETSPAYMDIDAELVGFGLDSGKDSLVRAFGDITLLNFNFERNLSVNQAYHYNLSVLGFRAGAVTNFDNDQIQLFAQASFDFVGVAFDAKRAADGVALSPSSFGTRDSYAVAFETGVNLFKHRVRLAFGGKVLTTRALGESYFDGTYTCTTYEYYDEYTGQYYYTDECDPNYSTYYAERWKSKKYYVDLSVRVTKALRVFGRAGVQTFALEDDTGYFPNSNNSAWTYQVGVSYNINNLNKGRSQSKD